MLLHQLATAALSLAVFFIDLGRTCRAWAEARQAAARRLDESGLPWRDLAPTLTGDA